MLVRILEPEVMDTAEDAAEYNSMDHSMVNRTFVADLLAFDLSLQNPILDVGTGTALIPIELCQQHRHAEVVAIDLAEEMLKLAQQNIMKANLSARIRLAKVNGRALPYSNGQFPTVISNSIIHHIPDPFVCLSEMVRVCAGGGTLFVRDLLRPADEATLAKLVQDHAGDANARQRRLFADSLRAALTLAEVQTLVVQLGFDAKTVAQTSNRHWTWAARSG